MKRFYTLYQYLAPVLLLPLSTYLWLLAFQGDRALVAYVMALPIITSYVIPALGTNVTRLWAFSSGVLPGGFRPHHGFVFGSATSMLVFLAIDKDPMHVGWSYGLQAGFVIAAVLGFWNWLYDIYAIKAGFIVVYNKQYAEGKGPEAIATDYAPIYFGTFGFIYGLAIKTGQWIFLQTEAAGGRLAVFMVFLALCLIVPTGLFALASKTINGHYGVRPYAEPEKRSE